MTDEASKSRSEAPQPSTQKELMTEMLHGHQSSIYVRQSAMVQGISVGPAADEAGHEIEVGGEGTTMNRIYGDRMRVLSPSTTGGKELIEAEHLGRQAIVYIRRATTSQINADDSATSVQQQMRLVTLAMELGWDRTQVHVCEDIGQSGASLDRPGLSELLRSVERGQVGLVLAVDEARLSGSSGVTQQVIERLAASDTLLLLGTFEWYFILKF